MDSRAYLDIYFNIRIPFKVLLLQYKFYIYQFEVKIIEPSFI